MKTFFIADIHFGHDAILRYENRPFKDAAEQDEVLIRNWNGAVSADDEVFLVGDFTAYGEEKSRAILSQLLQDGPLGQLLLIDAVFQTEPEQIVELGGAAVKRIALEEFSDPFDIQPLPHEADHHVEIVIRRAVREEGHEGRLKRIVPGSVPDDIPRAPGRAGKMLFDHVGKTTPRVRSDGMRAAITSRIKPRS